MRPRLLLVAALLVYALPAAAAVPLPDERERWTEVAAGEFRVAGNTSAWQTRQTAVELLRLQQAAATITRLNVHFAAPVYVYLFADERSFAPYRQAVFGSKKTPFTGAFHSGPLGNFVMMRVDSAERASHVVYHELTHAFVRNTVHDAPPWFNEGLAEFYSTFTSSGGSVELGKAIPEHISLLRAKPLIPLREFFAMDYRAYTESDRVSIYYAEAWAIVHYLLEQSDRTQLAKFLALLAAGRPPEAAFNEAYAMTYEQFEQRIRGYVSRSIFSYTSYPVGSLQVPEVPEPQPMTRPAVLGALARLLFDTGSVSDAESFLNEALRVAPGDAGARALLAQWQEKRSAIVMGAPRTSMSQDVMSGYDALQEARRTSDAERIAHALHARELFARAVQQHPKSAEALAGLGATYTLTDDDPAPGIAALEQAVASHSAMPDAVASLVFLYARAGRLADAQAAWKQSASDSMAGRMVESSFADGSVERAKSLDAQGKRDEAIAWMEKSIAAAPGDHARREITAFLESLTAASAADWSDFQAAVDKANAPLRRGAQDRRPPAGQDARCDIPRAGRDLPRRGEASGREAVTLGVAPTDGA